MRQDIQSVPGGMCQTSGGPCVKVCRYNPKHLCPKSNGYGGNGQRKVWSSVRVHVLYLSADKTYQSFPSVWCLMMAHTSCYASYVLPSGYDGLRSQPCYVSACHSCVLYSAWNPKDNYDIACEFFCSSI
jgi:hypothetical protein